MPAPTDTLADDLRNTFADGISLPDPTKLVRRAKRRRRARLVVGSTGIAGLLFAGATILGDLERRPTVIETRPASPSTTAVSAPVDDTAGAFDIAASTIVVLNGSGTSGRAEEVTCQLQREGYVTTTPLNAPDLASTTVVIGSASHKMEAKGLGAHLGTYSVASPEVEQLLADEGADVAVLVGADWAESNGGCDGPWGVPK